MSFRDRLRSFGIKLRHWEYWPWTIVYIPVFIQYFFQSVISGKFTYPTQINRPFMEFGGIFEESKWHMHQLSPKALVPKTELLPNFNSAKELKEFLNEKGFTFPLIIKPERGMRGKGIQKILSFEQLEKLDCDPLHSFLIQEYLDYKLEIGLFAFKSPKTNEWKISSIMERGFPTITGDGKNSIEQLIRKNPRYFLQLARWKCEEKFDFGKTLPKGEELVLDHIGNHRLGTVFKDAQHRINSELTQTIGVVCDSFKGLEYGRLDIVFNSWEELNGGKNFSIIEINGTNSEPSHIYDPKHSIFYAWRGLMYHFGVQYFLAKNAQKRGCFALSHAQAYRLFKAYNHTMTDLD